MSIFAWLDLSAKKYGSGLRLSLDGSSIIMFPSMLDALKPDEKFQTAIRADNAGFPGEIWPRNVTTNQKIPV